MKSRFLSSIFIPICASLLLSPLALGGMAISLQTGSFSGNTPAIEAFNRGAALWSRFINDNITVQISASFGSLGAEALGSSNITTFADRTFGQLTGAMIADATASASVFDDQAKLLPTTTTAFKSQFPVGYVPNGQTYITSANDKALFGNFSGLDAAITFSNSALFDYDNSDGVTSGRYDFESVVAHEIGHALGFFSSLDFPVPKPEQPTPLDLFRFSKATPSERSLTVGAPAVTNGGIFSFEMSTGAGYQASHWLNSDPVIGLMNPTMATGVFYGPSWSDAAALDLIGYDINYAAVPEVSTLSLGLLSLLAVLRRRRSS